MPQGDVTNSLRVEADECPIDGCKGAIFPPVLQDGKFKWSEEKTWEEYVKSGSIKGPLPQDGDTIVVSEKMELFVDTNTPKLEALVVYGKLTFVDRINVNVTATYILVE